MAYQDKIAYEPTLAEALVSLFGGGADGGDSRPDGQESSDSDDDVKSLINKAQNAYEKAIECQKNGDWEGYGKYIKLLENYLTKLANESGAGAAAAPAAAEPAEEAPAADDAA